MQSIAIALLTVALSVQSIFIITAIFTIRKRILELNGNDEPSITAFMISHGDDSVVQTHRRTLELNGGPMLILLAGLAILLR